MGTTTNFGLPYPDGTDLVIQGDDDMQALAEAVDDTLAWSSGAVIARAESPSSTGGVVDFTGTQHLMEDFTYSSGLLTYTGPGRLLLVEVEVEVITGSNAVSSSTVEVRANGTAFSGSHDEVNLSSGNLSSRHFVHRITTALVLQTGETIDVVASSTPAGTVGIAGLRVYPVGPVLP